MAASDEHRSGNLYANLPRTLPHERVDILLEAGGTTLERIVSTGQATPAGQWYDQPHAEWVLLLQGSAGLRFEDERETRTLAPGDHVFIPAHARHRVEWTRAHEPTVWLALHLPKDGGS